MSKDAIFVFLDEYPTAVGAYGPGALYDTIIIIVIAQKLLIKFCMIYCE